jgi:hypothetical protein
VTWNTTGSAVDDTYNLNGCSGTCALAGDVLIVKDGGYRGAGEEGEFSILASATTTTVTQHATQNVIGSNESINGDAVEIERPVCLDFVTSVWRACDYATDSNGDGLADVRWRPPGWGANPFAVANKVVGIPAGGTLPAVGTVCALALVKNGNDPLGNGDGTDSGTGNGGSYIPQWLGAGGINSAGMELVNLVPDLLDANGYLQLMLLGAADGNCRHGQAPNLGTAYAGVDYFRQEDYQILHAGP